MKTPLLAVICASLFLFLLGACSTLPRPIGFAGNYAGAAIESDPDSETRSLVEGLEVTEEEGSYSLAGHMNATNQEPGMDHVSNTRSHWSGTGTVKGDTLVFTYSSTLDERGTGSLRFERGGLLLTLGHIQYRLHRAPP